jgi:C-terminal processing protease CtpA/Prc
MNRAKGAITTADTYDAIRHALFLIGDNHSWFFEPDQVGSAPPAPVGPSPVEPGPAAPPSLASPPTGKRLESKIGYVLMPTFNSMGLSAEQIADHATSYHALISEIDAEGMCGWIVDLRANNGGNMWPMLAGIGPILGEGRVGMFIDPDSVKNHWYYENGRSLNGTNIQTSVNGTPYELIDPDPTVAIIHGRITASSGEAQVIAFTGRPNTKSFGQETTGVPTANRGFYLSDGALLNLTVSWMADRTGRKYWLPLLPDEDMPGDLAQDPALDPVVWRAEEWILQNGACSGG